MQNKRRRIGRRRLMAKLLELLAEAGSALADTLLSAVFKAKDGRTAAAGTDVSAVANPGRQDCCRSASPAGPTAWCTLAYWEERQRVGRLFPVTSPLAEVFCHLPRPGPKGDALCLATIAAGNTRPSEATLRTRDKIGLGVIISQEGGGVWLYNRTDVPVFVNSPTLDTPNTRTFNVLKLRPGYSMQVFDYEKSRYYQRIRDPRTLDGPFDPNAVRLSFAKGWGAKYSRQVVTSCPCWLEVLLVPPR